MGGGKKNKGRKRERKNARTHIHRWEQLTTHVAVPSPVPIGAVLRPLLVPQHDLGPIEIVELEGAVPVPQELRYLDVVCGREGVVLRRRRANERQSDDILREGEGGWG